MKIQTSTTTNMASFDTFLSKYKSSHFQTQIHLPKSIAKLLPYGFIWTPVRPGLDQTIFEPRYTFPKLLQICFHMASFGHLFCPDINQAMFKPKYTFPNPSQMKNHSNHMLRAIDALAITKPFFVATKPHAHVHVCIVCI